MPDLYGLSRLQLERQIVAWGFPTAHAAPIWHCLYRQAKDDLSAIEGLPRRLQERLLAEARSVPLAVAHAAHSADGSTRKDLLRLGDGRRIETVLMRYRGRATACVSSQAGCALGCVFCATGQAGFARNLTTGEIVAQVLHAERLLRSEQSFPPPFGRRGSPRDPRQSLRNVVVMGMGEPLLNYDAVMNALDIVCDPGGLAIGAKQITISTAGVVPGIVRLADERRPFSLAVSLHAADQVERAALMPVAKTCPLDELLRACRHYAAKLQRKIFIEWTAIEGANDSPAQAARLAQLLAGIDVQVNLIPLNATSGYRGQMSDGTSLARFRDALKSHGLPVSVRQRRGLDIAAGCGQLATAN